MVIADRAQILQNRIIAGLKSGEGGLGSLKQPQRPDLEVYVAALEKAVSEAEVRSERWRQETDAAVKRVAARQHWLPGTQEAITEAEAIAEQRRQEANVAAKRADDLLAELFEMTSEHVEMSRWIAERPPGTTKFSKFLRLNETILRGPQIFQ